MKKCGFTRSISFSGALVLIFSALLASCGTEEKILTSSVPSQTSSQIEAEASNSLGSTSEESFSSEVESQGASMVSSSKPASSKAGEQGSSSAALSKPSSENSSAAKGSVSKATMNFRKPGDKNTLGVWWWTIGDIKTPDGEKYLNFLKENNVSEIYLCIDAMKADSGVNYADVRAFVKKAGTLGMRVGALTGDYNWIDPSNNGFQKYVDNFNAYQSKASASEKFYSMHLDVEPHQHPVFKTNETGRAKIMQWFADFAVKKALPAAKASKTLLEWDIPFWMTDVVKHPDTGNNVILSDLMAEICDTVSVMSYRDTAAGIYNVSKEEIAAAKKYGHKIVLGAETYSTEGDAVSFMEEGKEYMASELYKLNDMLINAVPNRNFGIAIHQVKRWYDLKD